jgi:hypothetical protein
MDGAEHFTVRFPVTVTHLSVTHRQICHRPVAYRPGCLSAVLTEHYRRARPRRLASCLGNLLKPPPVCYGDTV